MKCIHNGMRVINVVKTQNLEHEPITLNLWFNTHIVLIMIIGLKNIHEKVGDAPLKVR
jgi:hypothetical protein